MKVIAVLLCSAIGQCVLGNPVDTTENCSDCDTNGTKFATEQTKVENCTTFSLASDGTEQIIDRQCTSNDPDDPSRCYSVTDVWTVQVPSGDGGYCADYQCIQPNKLPYANITNLGCRWLGQCYDHNETWEARNCLTYTCNINMTTYSVSFSSLTTANCTGCNSNGTIYGVNETWVEDCVTYSCVRDQTIQIIDIQCASNNPDDPVTCHAVNEVWGFQVPKGDSGYCADYRCIPPSDTNQPPYVNLTKLGCRWQGQCYDDDASWDGPNCATYTCSINMTTYAVSYSSKTSVNCSGCSINGTTYAIDETWVENCRTYKCVSHETVQIIDLQCTSNNPDDPPGICYAVDDVWSFGVPNSSGRGGYFADYQCVRPDLPHAVITNLACMWQGQRHENDATWDVPNCVRYTCNVNMVTLQVSYPALAGCSSNNPADANGTCYAVNDVWSVQVPSGQGGYCADYRCVQSANLTILPSPQLTSIGCRWLGQCYNNGESWDIPNCLQFTCITSPRSYRKVQTSRGCVSNNPNDPPETCYAVDAVWSVEVPRGDGGYCSVNRCIQSRNLTILPSPQRTSLGCRWRGQCYGNDESWNIGNCLKYTCVSNMQSYGKVPSSRGCLVDGICWDNSETWLDCSPNESPYEDTGSCSTYECVKNGDQYDPIKTNTKCTLGGVAYAMNEWQEYDSTTCVFTTCSYTENTQNQVSTSFQQHCRDVDGHCHTVGTWGWPYIEYGVRKENCTCNPVGSTHITYSCN